MAQPPDYYPTYNFSEQEWKANLLPLWDVEFAAISATLEKTLHNLAILQRDDTKLANGIVHPLALSPETIALIATQPWAYAGKWVPNTFYDLGVITVFQGSSYLSAKCHTSAVCPVEGDAEAVCAECVFVDPENPTEDELLACFTADYEDRERWIPLCCGGTGTAASSICIMDATGTATAYEVVKDVENPILEYVDGMKCVVRWNLNSGIGATLSWDGLAAKAISFDNSATDTDDLVATQMDVVVYNATTDTFDLIGRDRTSLPTVETAWFTGDTRTTMRRTAAAGWTFLDGLTIGDVGSGADFEGAEYEDLFELLKDVTPNLGTEVWATGGVVYKPDAQNRDILGWSLMSNLGGVEDPADPSTVMGGFLGSAQQTLTVDQMPSHRHTVQDGGYHRHWMLTSSYNNDSGTGRCADKYPDNTDKIYSDYDGNHNHTLNYTGGGESFGILDPKIVMAIEIRL